MPLALQGYPFRGAAHSTISKGSTLPEEPIGDPFELPFCGLPDRETEGTVLISGGGDGALQDLMRVVTRRKSPKEIFRELFDGISFDTERNLAAEVIAERAMNWSDGASFASPYVAVLHAAHLDVVCETLNTNLLVVERVRRMAEQTPWKCVLVCRQQHFSYDYGLNRFLALVL